MRKALWWRERNRLMRCALLLLPLLLCGSVAAQTGTSTVRGNVLDATNKAIPGATVTLTDVAKNTTRTQTTAEDGSYTFNSVPPGLYRIEAEATGFKKGVVKEVRALVDTPVTVDVPLEAGNINETVVVVTTGLDALVNTQDATLGNNFVPQQIQELPLESQNVPALLSLQPAVTTDGYVAGARADQSNITLDGVDVNEQQTNAAFTSVLRTTTSSVEEFRVTITNPNAQQGRSAGAQVSLVTKSGTNDLHGSLYEYHRNTVTTANTFFNNRAGSFGPNDPQVLLGQAVVGQARVPRPKLLRNVFGGSLGGPIKKDRLFFFYNYEGRRDSAETPVVHTVPLATLGQGIVRYPNGSGGITQLSAAQINALFPAAGENPAALAFLANAARKYPANDFTVGDSGVIDGQLVLLNTAGFRFNAPTSLKWNTHIARFDYNLKRDGSQIVFLRGNYQHDHVSDVRRFPDTPPPTEWSHPYGFVVGHTWTLNNRQVNNLRYGLTREAFTDTGDSDQDAIVFRSIFQQFDYSRTLKRVTPVQNITDDFSWALGNHSTLFGTNIRLIRNERVDFSRSFDNASTNYFFYATSGSSLSRGISNIRSGYRTPVRVAVSGVIGRFSQYSENFNYDLAKNLTPSGTGVPRTFATQQYDVYGQDSWKLRPNFTLTYGLRWGVSTPVYETHGFMTAPSIPLGEFFDRRVAGSFNGQPFNDLITVDLAGKKYGKPGFYKTDWNNFQPRVAVAWSPNFKHGVLHGLFGNQDDSVVRGGFAMINDNFGEALAVNFEGNNRLGFSTQTTISANTFNTTSSLGPQFTGLGQTIRGLPRIVVPTTVSFPQLKPADMERRIEGSLDSTLQTPVNYLIDLSYGRKLPGKFYLELSYIGRHARHLLATRDVATPNNLRDPRSGMDWYTAAGILETLRVANTPTSAVRDIPYFNNIFQGINLGDVIIGDPSLTNTQAIYNLVSNDGFGIGNDWTTVQDIIDASTGTSFFYNPQYGALAAFSTVGESDYHAGTVTLRERLGTKLTMDFNYTLSKSMDTASGLQTSGVYGAAIILNPFTPRAQRAVSDFDTRHIINVNAIWQLPIGHGQAFLSNMPKVLDGILGGWQLSGIYRWNSGIPAGAPFDAAQWATNWEIQSNGVRIRPINQSSTRGNAMTDANIFSDPVAAYQSFRSARPGEVGDRNVLRFPGYVSLDMGLAKTFHMPWEGHTLQFRWDTFNVTNTQRLTGIDGFSLDLDPENGGSPSPGFGKFTDIQGSPRVMQFGLKYRF